MGTHFRVSGWEKYSRIPDSVDQLLQHHKCIRVKSTCYKEFEAGIPGEGASVSYCQLDNRRAGHIHPGKDWTESWSVWRVYCRTAWNSRNGSDNKDTDRYDHNDLWPPFSFSSGYGWAENWNQTIFAGSVLSKTWPDKLWPDKLREAKPAACIVLMSLCISLWSCVQAHGDRQPYPFLVITCTCALLSLGTDHLRPHQECKHFFYVYVEAK